MGEVPLNQELQTDRMQDVLSCTLFPKGASIACNPHYPQTADRYLLSTCCAPGTV